MSEAVVYAGKDLEAMSFAVNYHRWILQEFRPFLGKHIVEVGAGTGSFSELILEIEPETLSLVEPSGMYSQLVSTLPKNDPRTRVDFYNATFRAKAAALTEKQRPDSIIYVNVLEHIEDDEGELAAIYESLDAGGRCFLFVPALKALYGDFDRKLGHFRRYTKEELEQKTTAAGFQILRSRYFDVAGVLPWFVTYRLLGSVDINPGAVNLYDKVVVPIFKRIESLVPFPAGKNILLIAEK